MGGWVGWDEKVNMKTNLVQQARIMFARVKYSTVECLRVEFARVRLDRVLLAMV